MLHVKYVTLVNVSFEEGKKVFHHNYSLYVLFAKDLHTIIFVENIFKYHHNPQYEDQLVKLIILRTWSCWNISCSGEEEWCLQQVDSV